MDFGLHSATSAIDVLYKRKKITEVWPSATVPSKINILGTCYIFNVALPALFSAFLFNGQSQGCLERGILRGGKKRLMQQIKFKGPSKEIQKEIYQFILN